MSDTLVFFDRAMIGHDPGPGHPDSPQRLRAIEGVLAAKHLPSVVFDSPAEVERAELERIHDPTYVQKLFDLEGEEAELDPDTHVSAGSLRAARLGAGAAVQAVDAVCRGEHANAFALVRPPGHHAVRDGAMGFCLFNNIAVAAAKARKAHGLERILIVDWDAHHGNGTQAAFYDDPNVLVINTHQYPFYPGTGSVDELGRGEGLGFNVNIALSEGSVDGDYVKAFHEIVLPIADQFAPDLVLVSAGFDAHRDDTIAGMRVSTEGFAELCALTQGIARRHCDGRIVLLLEGGYHLDALSDSVSCCLQVLTGSAAPGVPDRTGLHGDQDLQQVVRALSPHWTL